MSKVLWRLLFAALALVAGAAIISMFALMYAAAWQEGPNLRETQTAAVSFFVAIFSAGAASFVALEVSR